jgi:sensor histidine kinase YesM
MPELRALHGEIPVLPVKRIRETANLLQSIVDFIVKQFCLERCNEALRDERKLQESICGRRDELEVALLNSRLTPHFLFNALNAAGRQAHYEGASKTEDVIYALADMCRHMIRSSERSVTVEQEIQNVKNYMFIQKARFGELIEFEFDVAADISDCLIPAMSIQTLVENSMRHGLEKKSDYGHILVRGYEHDGMARFEITDDGSGMTKDRMRLVNDVKLLEEAMPSFPGTGILSLYRRLRCYWGDRFDLRFSENRGGGVSARLNLEIRRAADEGDPQRVI